MDDSILVFSCGRFSYEVFLQAVLLTKGQMSSKRPGLAVTWQLPDMFQTITVPGSGLTLSVTVQLRLGHPIALHLQPGFTGVTELGANKSISMLPGGLCIFYNTLSVSYFASDQSHCYVLRVSCDGGIISSVLVVIIVLLYLSISAPAL